MKTTPRLELAITKLYTAFHNNELHPECCKQCAVGNILDKKDSWKHLTDIHGSVKLNYVGHVHQNFGRKFNGYTPLQLLQIEAIFLKGCGYSGAIDKNCKKPENPQEKDTLFNGLCMVIEYLCHLDNIQNVMDYKKLFKFKNNTTKNSLIKSTA